MFHCKYDCVLLIWLGWDKVDIHKVYGFTSIYFPPFLARLFWKKTSRYCHSPGVVGGGGVVVGGVVQIHFLTSLLLLKIFT